MRKCTSCKKDFDDSLTTTCSWCGTINSESDTNTTSETIERVNKIEHSTHPSEKALDAVADFILIFGIISFVVLFFTVGYVSREYSSKMEFSLTGFGTALTPLISSIVARSIMKVIVLISINTRKTKEYLEHMHNKQEIE